MILPHAAHRSPACARRAFSLFEAVLAIALIVGLSGAVFTFLFNLGRQREGLDRQTVGLRGGAALFDALESDLASVIAADPHAGSGVRGSETSLSLLVRGVAPPRPGAGSATLVADLQGVEYAFDERAGTLSARRWSVLEIGSAAAAAPMASDPFLELPSAAANDRAILADGVERVRFRYFDGSSWSASFDGARQGALPVAIEIAVWFGQRAEDADPDSAAALGANRAGDAGALGDPALGEDLDPEWLGDGADPIEDAAFEDAPLPPPDRVRTIVIPDGPVASWRASP